MGRWCCVPVRFLSYFRVWVSDLAPPPHMLNLVRGAVRRPCAAVATAGKAGQAGHGSHHSSLTMLLLRTCS